MIARSHQSQLLRKTELAVSAFSSRFKGQAEEARFQVLEAVASRLGGFDLDEYFKVFGSTPITNLNALLTAARAIVAEIERTGIPPALAISALARESLSHSDKRQSGAYHTDYRLALHLADGVRERLVPGVRIIDPACGAGILLAAATLAACGADRRLTASWLAKSVYASDLSPKALRGAQAALACLTDDLSAIRSMRNHWKVQDSLLSGLSGWKDVAKDGFDVVVANPPWEKIKLTRHEFIQADGVARHYGKGYDAFDQELYQTQRRKLLSYGAALAQKYATLNSGEPDLYTAFTELFLQLVKTGGEVRALLPAGLIRSQGTETLRKLLWSNGSTVEFEVFENRARFFEIDTRFKFLVVALNKNSKQSRIEPILLRHGTGTPEGVSASPRVRMSRSALTQLRPDLSIPEVRNDAEWRLFQKICKKGVNWALPDSPWFPEFMREVDMTRDRPSFKERRSAGTLPLVEGRMVHQHRFGAKSHISGTGRRAVWEVNPPGASTVGSQFWIPASSLSAKARARSKLARAGFCDITGQTNERSCMAAIVPAGVACGNKVPTILFPNDASDERLWLWVAIANSFPFDWMLRRVVTTTINYFLLLSVPLPPLEPDTLPGRQLIELAKNLQKLDMQGVGSPQRWSEIAELRAKADLIVATAYGLTAADVRLMFEDFPLLDRQQPPISGESRSTVTQDLLLRSFVRGGTRAEIDHHEKRFKAARALGAIAYLPSQVSLADDGEAGGIANEQ